MGNVRFDIVVSRIFEHAITLGVEALYGLLNNVLHIFTNDIFATVIYGTKRNVCENIGYIAALWWIDNLLNKFA